MQSNILNIENWSSYKDEVGTRKWYYWLSNPLLSDMWRKT